MKKTAFVLRLVAAGLMFALGFIVFILGLSGDTGSYYGGYYSTYEYQQPYHESYGGDAYTGIQNAAADTAKNVAIAGTNIANETARVIDSFANQMENIYIWSGIALIIVSIYLVGCTFSSYEPKAKKVQNDIPYYNNPQ